MTPGQGLNPNVASEAASQVRPLGDEVWRTQVRIHPVSSAHIMAEMSLDKTSLFKSYPEIYTNIFPWQLRAASWNYTGQRKSIKKESLLATMEITKVAYTNKIIHFFSETLPTNF